MNATDLYDKLKNDFIKDGIKDVGWADRMPGLHKYLFPEFINNGGMGLMCDFTVKIKKVYTTVFLSENVLSKLINDDAKNAVLFSHHPTNWNLKDHNGNYAVGEEYIINLKKRNISVYILHHPLDNYGAYSTCKTLAEQLGIVIERPAFLYYGAYCGVVGTTDCRTTGELQEKYAKTAGHRTSLYQYGDENIENEKIALCPGGGNDMFVVNEMQERGINTLVTGVTIVNDRSRKTHEFEHANRINVLGGTHYTSEKYAPIKMCEYFNGLGMTSEFINGEPDLLDL